MPSNLDLPNMFVHNVRFLAIPLTPALQAAAKPCGSAPRRMVAGARLQRPPRHATPRAASHLSSCTEPTQESAATSLAQRAAAGCFAAFASAAAVLSPLAVVPPAAQAVSGGGGTSSSLSFQDLSGQVTPLARGVAAAVKQRFPNAVGNRLDAAQAPPRLLFWHPRPLHIAPQLCRT